MRVSPELLALLEPPQACPAGVTFVTVLANETYAPGALCLRHSLRLVGSKCPITLVLDDLDDRVPFSASTMSVLRSSFGPSYLLSLSDMYARVVSHNASAQYPSQAERPPPLLSAGVAQQSPVRRKGAARLSTEARARLREELKTELKAELRAELAQELRGGAGRRLRATFSGASHLSRLPRAGTWARGTHKKLLLWAMPGVSRAVFLDLDMLVVKNIDALAALPAFSAVAALPYSLRFFNSGARRRGRGVAAQRVAPMRRQAGRHPRGHPARPEPEPQPTRPQPTVTAPPPRRPRLLALRRRVAAWRPPCNRRVTAV